METRLESWLHGIYDEDSLLGLFASMGYEYAQDEPVNKSTWGKTEKDAVKLSRIISKIGTYKIYYVEIDHDNTPKVSRCVAERIIKNDYYSLICSYNHDDSTWMFSSPTEVTGSRVCHIPVSVKNQIIIPKDFVMVAKKMQINKDDSAQTVFHRITDAFNAFSDPKRNII